MMTFRIAWVLFFAAASYVGSVASSLQAAAEPTKDAVESRNKAAVEDTLRSWMAGDGTALQALLSDEIEWTIAGNSLASGTTRGRAELMQKVLAPFGARFASSSDKFKPREIYGVFADGNTVVAHFKGSGTTNTGQPYQNSYVWLLTMRDGKVIRANAFFDSIAFNELWQNTTIAPAR
jgi:ketosteroid isomerase-like protein